MQLNPTLLLCTLAALAAPAAFAAEEGRTLVVFFSHTGENYNVGVITEGNTAVIAKMIAAKTGADSFEIKPVRPYPKTYGNDDLIGVIGIFVWPKMSMARAL
jgi:flavodoxin